MKTRSLIAPALRETIKVYPKLFSYWYLLAILHAISFLAAEAFSYQQEAVLDSGKESIFEIFIYFAGGALVDIALTTAWAVLVVRIALVVLNESQSLKNYFSDLNRALIESVRAMARMLLWFLALIVPGFVKFVRLTLVPFVVVSDPNYKAGQVDALDRSEQLTKGKFWLVATALLLSTLLPSLPVLLLHGSNISLASQPITSITCSVFEFFTGLLATCFLFCLYRQLSARLNAGA